MSDLRDVFGFVADILYEYFTFMNSHWFTQVILYVFVLGIVVSVLLALRGN